MSNLGIYAIRHTGSGRLYVGSSKDLKARWLSHKSFLRRGRHVNPKLQNAWNKYGEAAFEFWIVHTVETENDLLDWEQFWLDKLKPWFNIRKTAESNYGLRHTEESRQRMSAFMTERMKDPANRAIIGAATKARVYTPESRAKMAASQRERLKDPEARARCGPPPKIYNFISPDGDPVEIHNLNKFCRDNNLNQGNMSSVHAGIKPHHKGWRKNNAIDDCLRDRSEKGSTGAGASLSA